MPVDGAYHYKRLHRLGEAVVLAVVLCGSLAAATLLANSITYNTPGVQPGKLPDFLIMAPLALAAALIGLLIASWLDLAGRGWGAAANRAALVSLSFTAVVGAFGISRALIAAGVSLPGLVAATWLFGRWGT